MPGWRGCENVRKDAPATAAVSEEALAQLRVPLLGYCYRMLGGWAEAEDAVQDTLVKVDRHRGDYRPGRGSLKTWVYAIATRVCLDALRAARRRAAPLELATGGPGSDLGAVIPPESWVQPASESLLLTTRDPAELVAQRESIRLALVAALQYLPARQRAVLILRDVLALSARETAAVLDLSVAATASALQRARGTIAARRPAPGDTFDPSDAAQRNLVDRYVAAFEANDVTALVAVLRSDVIATMPPYRWRLDGADRVATVFGESDACAHHRLIPTPINGEPGLGQYQPESDGTWSPFALVWLAIRQGLITQVTTFLGTGARFAEFDLPPELT